MNKDIERIIDKTKNLLKTAACKDLTEDLKIKQEKEYAEARDAILNIPELKNYIPSFLNNTTVLDGFRLNMKEYGGYDERKKAVSKDFKDIEEKLKNLDKQTVIPEGFELSQEQVRSKIREHFNKKHSKLKNIYGEFTQTQKQLGSGGTSIIKAFELIDIAGNKLEYAFKFLAENIHGEKEGKSYKRFKQAHLNISCIQHTGAILPQVHIDKLKIADDLIIPYVMMPVADMTLKKYIMDLRKNGELNFEKTDEIFEELCKIIKTIHEKNIIHRDIKPENIFLYDGKIVLGDFDIAKFSDDVAKFIDTKDGERLANFNCSAPEQSSNTFEDITVSADWYALGQTLHWIITNEYKRGVTAINYSKYGEGFRKYENIVSTLLSDNPEKRLSLKNNPGTVY